MVLGEAKLAAQPSHPNVVHIYEFGKVEQDYFIAMEFVDGVHAGQVFKLAEPKATGEADKMPPVLVARIGADAASALHYAHDLRGANGKPVGLVHRDVSPANIMISHDGVVKLCDFGIAKAAALSDQLTNPGQVKGKYAYMSPEQTVASHLDGRSDVFSLAIVLWELLTGKFIVERGDAVEAMRAIRDGKLEPLARAAPTVPPALANAIAWALEPARDNRATAAQLAEALEAFIKSSPELGTSMQLASWIRARFQRDTTGQLPALTFAGAGTAAASPGTIVAPGTVIASGTQGPVTPPPAAPSKLAARVMEDHSGPYGSDLDDEVSQTLKRPPRPPPTVQLTPSHGDSTLIDDGSQRAAEESTLRDRGSDTEFVDALATVQRDPRPAPAVATASRESAPRESAQRAPTSGARARAISLESERRRTPLPSELVRRRRMRILFAVAGLTGLAIVSFAIALAASGGGHSRAQSLDAAPVAIAPAQHPDAAAVIVAPPPPRVIDAEPEPAPADAAVAMGYLEVRTVPAGGTVKVGDQTRTAPAQLIIPAGHVAVIAELAGFANERREVDLEAGEHHELEIAFTKKLRDHPDRHGPELGKLTVRTNPYSDVYESGTLIASTPFAERAMSVGPHTLVFKNPKHATIEKKIVIVAGKTLKLNFALP